MNQQVNLKEILHPKMYILFVALNPPKKSNSNGHYFSGSMSFWNLIFKAGLITKEVNSPLSGDNEVFRDNKINYNNNFYGITDLCHDIVQTNSTLIYIDKHRVQRILSLLENYEVKKLCLMHSDVGKAFKNISGINRSRKYGLIGKINNTLVYEMPFHCASISNKEMEYKKLI